MIPQTLSEANDLILGMISSSEERTILGFLPLSGAEEEAILDLVKAGLRGGSDNITWLYFLHPAAMAYALAIAPSRALHSGGEFWPSLKRELGIDVPVGERKSVAHEFRRECKQLGLLDGTLENAGWHLAAPLIFQSGILHYWKSDLAGGLRSVLRSRPAPDNEDPSALRDFTDELCTAIHHQANLRKMLATEAGPLLVQRLVAGYLAGDWSRLPAHLQEPVREAFSGSGRGMVLRSPYLTFDTAFEQLAVVLPAQLGGVASPETFWRIGTRRHAARKETVIPLRELEEGEIVIHLQRLEAGFTDRDFRINPHIGDLIPFRVFRKDSGREVFGHAGKSVEVPAGGYLVVTAADVTAGKDESPTSAEPYIYYDLDLRPGDPALVLERSGISWSISARREHGLFIDREAAKSLLLQDGSMLLYGKEPGIIGYFPSDGTVEGSFRLQVDCPEQNVKVDREITTPSLEQGGYRFVSEIREPMAGAFDALPAGIHRLEVSISGKARKASRMLWYWKGLDHISNHFGFRCSALPENLDVKASRGVTGSSSGLSFLPDYHAPFVSLHLKRPQATLVLPRAGIRVTLMEPGAVWEDELAGGPIVTVGARDKRLLKFSAGGSHSWRIMGGGREIAVLDGLRGTRVLSLAGVAAEIGGSGRITTTSEDGSEIGLLSLTRPLSATAPAMTPEHGQGLVVWTFMVPTEDLETLGVSVTDLSSQPDEQAGDVLDFACRTAEGFECSVLSLPGTPVTLRSQCAEANGSSSPARVQVRLEIRDAELADGLWAIDFHRRGTNEIEWLPLDCDEKHGYSKLRIFAWGPGRPASEAGWWRHLRRAGRPDNRYVPDACLAGALRAMSAGELDQALASCRRFLEWKYPTSVWNHGALRVQDFPVHLATHRFGEDAETSTTWWKHAAEELSCHSRSTVTPVARQFLFGSQPDCLRLHGGSLTSFEQRDCSVTRSLNLPAEVAEAGGLKGHILPAYQEGGIDEKVIFCFANFIAVSSGKDPELSRFCLKSFLRGCAGIEGLEQRMEDLHITSPHAEVVALLGPAHFLHAVRALNRRCRIIEESSLSDETTPLSRMAQTLERISQQLEMVGPAVAQRTGWSPAADPIWHPPLLENPTSKKVAGILWVLCGLCRLAANRHLSKSEYDQLLSRLLDPGGEGRRTLQNRICILLSLAPELFALFVALFELQTYKPVTRNACP